MAAKNSKQEPPVVEPVATEPEVVEVPQVHTWTPKELLQGHLDGDAPSEPSVASPDASDAPAGTQGPTGADDTTKDNGGAPDA